MHESLDRRGISGKRCKALTMRACASSILQHGQELGEYEITQVQSAPTLSLLDAVELDNVTEDWSLKYEMMAVLPA